MDRLIQRTVQDPDGPHPCQRTMPNQRIDNAAATDQAEIRPCQRQVEGFRQCPFKAGPVSGIGKGSAVIIDPDGIGTAAEPGGIGKGVCQCMCRPFVRDGHIESGKTFLCFRKKFRHVIRRYMDRTVLRIFSGSAERGVVHIRRQRMGNGITDNGKLQFFRHHFLLRFC